MAAWRLLLCSSSSRSWTSCLPPSPFPPSPPSPPPPPLRRPNSRLCRSSTAPQRSRLSSSSTSFLIACRAVKGNGVVPEEDGEDDDDDEALRASQRAALWAVEAAYIIWLFLLPYAPGDPVWAIKQGTINDLLGLSLNFFFILPLINSVGIHVMEAPVLHPMAEGLFNFVIGWTLMFAPLLFTDCRRDRYKGSLDLLWGFQMFLTNAFLIPYMAIRLDDMDVKLPKSKPSKLASLMTIGASVVGIIGGLVCLTSAIWAFFGRPDGGFGDILDRWDYLARYLGSERLAYAFIWDICLYAVFQPWLIGDNIQNVKKSSAGIVSYLRFIPVVGLVAYLVNFEDE